ncbi:MAG: hypothetical protein WA160_00715 [Pseudobdellovibrio sp.]
MKLLKVNIVILVLLLISWCDVTFAQQESSQVTEGEKQLSTGAVIPSTRTNGPVVFKNKSEKKQTLNFEDELVEGSAQKPELFYLFQKKNFNYKRLIKLRENFLPEMRNTAEDVQRLRGGH